MKKYKSIQPFGTWDGPGVVKADKPGQVFYVPQDLTLACAERLVLLNLLEEDPKRNEAQK